MERNTGVLVAALLISPAFGIVAWPQRVIARCPRSTTLTLCEAEGAEADEQAQARLFLGLQAQRDRDVQRYLQRGTTLLGRQIAVLIPADPGLEEALLLASTKLVKLGASVVMLCAAPEQCVSLSSRVLYPRCIVRQWPADAMDLQLGLAHASGLIATVPGNAEEFDVLNRIVRGSDLSHLVLLSQVLAQVDSARSEWERAILHTPAEAARLSCILRICPLFGGKASSAALESLLNDALGLPLSYGSWTN
jgi:hypothetical protein